MTDLYLRNGSAAAVLYGDSLSANYGFLLFDSSRTVADGDGTIVGPAAGYGGNLTSVRWLSTTAGASEVSFYMTTPAGPINGVLFKNEGINLWTTHVGFISPPLAADVTISSTVSFYIDAYESSMSANATCGVSLYRIDSQGALTLIVRSSYGTELTTSSAYRSWTASPTSTNMTIGDRFLAVLWIDDATSVTMGSGYTVYFLWDQAAGSRISTTETLSFQSSAPTGTVYYLRDTNSDISGAKVLSTTQGSATATAAKSTAAGPHTYPGVQWTATAGGSAIEWFTPQVEAVTLSGAIEIGLGNDTKLCNYSGSGADSVLLEIAVTDSVGGSPVVFGRSYFFVMASDGSTTPQKGYVQGAGLSVSQGQRIRFRLYHEDAYYTGTQQAGYTRTMRYGGTGSYGSYITFSQTLTEYAPTYGYPFPRRDRRIVPSL